MGAVTIVPVGFDLGPVFALEPSGDPTPSHHEVRLGAAPQRLTADEYAMWHASFTEPPPEADPVVARLLERGLLLAFDPAADLEKPFGVHRLYPSAPGLGSTPDAPMEYAVGDDANSTIVPANVLTVWSFGLTSPTLWDACAQLAADADTDLPPGVEPLDLSTDEVAWQVAYELPELLRARAAYLDLLNYELPRVPAPVPLPEGQGRAVGSANVVPVGLSMGRDCGTDDGAGESAWQVHLGIDYADLDADEATVWRAAFSDVDRHASGEATRAFLEERARQRDGVTDAHGVVTRLLERGLLLALPSDRDALADVFRAVQLYPLGEGLGNTPALPGLYGIGTHGRRHLGVSREAYTIWAYSLTGRSLWDTCAELADGLEGTVSAGWLADEIAAVLPALVASGTAFIDPLNYAM